MNENNETLDKKPETMYGENQVKEALFTIIYTVVLVLLMWLVSSFMN